MANITSASWELLPSKCFVISFPESVTLRELISSLNLDCLDSRCFKSSLLQSHIHRFHFMCYVLGEIHYTLIISRVKIYFI